ncbi:MAG: multidrug efflux RND transporter permease subunit [Alphaproteobacteria bacterium]|nr:multidrug efflux RND transporter permease subunit [Alphaproteobacteria bacterium]|tara:strand:+ start:1031 stop:4213 length:3183 start_codon:yes stop_codon:yes gene_type:complete
MNISGFYIDRPIFASVLSILIFMAGLIAMFQLPISEYPEVSPPSVVVSAQFPGANPTVISETVATPLEEQINGVENMLYMNSLASSDGSVSLRVTFAIGTDPDLAQQLVQNRVSQAEPRLPEVTRRLGVTVTKSSPDLTMVVHLRSPDDRYDTLYLRNYGTLNVKDELAKIDGVGEVRLFGSGDYAMRVWLNPNKVAERGMSAGEVVAAIQAQNIQVAAGVVGGPPYQDGVQLQMPVNVQGRLETPEEFGNIIIKRDDNGVITRLSDVARLEMDSQTYALRSMLNNQQAVAIPIFASPGANALQISTDVRAKMAEMKERMPEGVDYSIVYDPTVFVKDSIKAVIKTLLEAVLLVVIVVVVFLQTWRASIIPLLAVPVSIVGTFAFMYMFGFSINVLSLFGLILAIGIVVDDAIVVVENVERNIEEGKAPRAATIQAMKEVTGPVIATSLVLMGVFVPIAFISGLTGQFYQQFALTIAIATFISTVNSLTLSPALSALMLKPKDQQTDILSRIMDKTLGGFFRHFNIGFYRTRKVYTKGVGVFSVRRGIMMIAFAALIGVTGGMFKVVPKGFVPAQDKGYLIAFAQLPPGATLDRTEEVIREMSDIALKTEGVGNAVQFTGLSINGFVSSPSAGIVFVPLAPFAERDKDHHLNGFAIAETLQKKFSVIDEAYVAVFPPPPVRGLGTLGGFKLQLEDRTDQGEAAMAEIIQKVQARAAQDPALTGVFSNFNIGYPQLFVDVDRTKAEQVGVPVQEVFEAMQIYMGSMYVNDFNQFGRTYQVVAQADKEFRGVPTDITRLQVRNHDGNMVPLGSIVKVEETFGPETSMRYNAFRAADINGNAAPGFSSGQAQEAITKILNEEMPQGMAFEWTELTYQQILAGNTAIFIFPLCLFLVFLVLAAQYESLTLPLSVIMIVPMGILSAMVGVMLFGGDNNIFTQISLFVLAGLACKNAILIVEFARELEHQGRSVVEAAVESSKMRLRPIIMTSIAFIMGVLPLVLAHGAGAEMRHAIGIAVFSGMIGVTIFGLIFTPVFYVLLRKLELKLSGRHEAGAQSKKDIAA